jgi:Domain of unknown function (DUF4381)
MSAPVASLSLAAQPLAMQSQAAQPQAAPTQGLTLRDIHEPPPPPWWPPAPGWWLVVAVLSVAALMYFVRKFRRHRYLRVCERMFDDAIATAPAGPARVAAMSELLRRAARRVDPAADRLEGEAWLRFLDGAGGAASPGFANGPGRALLDGAYRPAVDAGQLDTLHALARARFLDLMQARR